MEILQTEEFLSCIRGTLLYDKVKKYKYAYEIIPEISKIVKEIGKTLLPDEYEQYPNDVWISRGARVNMSAELNGPLIICEGAQIRHGAYIRGSAIIGADAVIGNSTEIKNSIILKGVQLPHYNYVGDSILCPYAHLGAGAIISNVRGDKTEVKIKINGQSTDTSLKKLGALIGEGVEVGCNSVINPGSVIDKGARIYPLSFVRGYVPPNTIYKSETNIVKMR